MLKRIVSIQVRDSGGTYLARAMKQNKTASCTCGRSQAAEAVAKKVFGDTPFVLQELHSEGRVYKFNAIEQCPICKGEGWVCEDHPDKAWGHGEGCCGAAGAPCKCIEPKIKQGVPPWKAQSQPTKVSVL